MLGAAFAHLVRYVQKKQRVHMAFTESAPANMQHTVKSGGNSMTTLVKEIDNAG